MQLKVCLFFYFYKACLQRQCQQQATNTYSVAKGHFLRGGEKILGALGVDTGSPSHRVFQRVL